MRRDKRRDSLCGVTQRLTPLHPPTELWRFIVTISAEELKAGKPGALEGPRSSGEATAQPVVSDTRCHALPAVRLLLRS